MKLDPNDPTQTLVSGYLPAEPPAGMMARAAARYKAQPEVDRYKCFVLPKHVPPADAVRYGREKGLTETLKIEHQVAENVRAAPVVMQRWLVDAKGVLTDAPV